MIETNLGFIFLAYGEECRKHWKKRQKQTEEKHWKVKRKKNEEYEESQITIIYTSLVLNCILLENIFWKTVAYIFIPSNFIYAFQDTWNKVMMQQNSIYINIQIII